jgi:DNA-binding HxlR family transcriptional regulator
MVRDDVHGTGDDTEAGVSWDHDDSMSLHTVNGVTVVRNDTSEDPKSQPVRDLIHWVTQETRYNLIVDMLGHPNQAPSVPELAHTNPSVTKATINEHLTKLVRRGFVDRLVIPTGQRTRELPYIFYRVSKLGYAFLEQYNILPADDRLIQLWYSQVEKDDTIEKFEMAPRHQADVDKDPVDEDELRRLKAAVDTSEIGASKDNLVRITVGDRAAELSIKRSDHPLAGRVTDLVVDAVRTVRRRFGSEKSDPTPTPDCEPAQAGAGAD